MSDPFVLLESTSPNGDVIAVVEQDDATCYFYLKGEDPEFGTKSCWVRNVDAAPEQLDVARMRYGIPPMLPRRYCCHPAGAPPLRREGLTILWSEEGDSAALRENDELLAVIPLWSGRGGFHGYARDCLAESALCWPLGTPETNVQFERYRRAAEYWDSWSQGESPWPAFQERGCEAMARTFGPYSNYYAIDGGNWPPKALLRIPHEDGTVLVTVGVAIRAQPGAELYFDDPSPYRRIELGVRLNSSLDEVAIKRVASYVSAQSTLPWANHTFLGEGHTLPADVFADLSGGRFSFALLQAAPRGIGRVSYPPFRGDPITILWLTPISARERGFAKDHGSAALQQKLDAVAGSNHCLFMRPEVV